MSIRIKIILIVLPLLIVTLLLSGIASSFSARSGITRIAIDFLGFKARELRKYADNQWNLLVLNRLQEQNEYVDAVKNAVLSYARTIVRSATELIFAIDEEGNIVMQTVEVQLEEVEKSTLVGLRNQDKEGWIEISISSLDRVAHAFIFEPFGWYFLVTESEVTFYQEVTDITTQSTIILVVSSLISIILLFFFTRYLTHPLVNVVRTMRDIISYNDMSTRVEVEFRDEIGQLAHTFNIMIGELEKAYNQIKSFALRAVLAKKQEQRIRNIFQKYVPKDVIDRFFANPEGMLVGENRVLAILFSDIRSFTTISEGLMPDEIVSSLNRYFSLMVDIIMNANGIVDKYIGDGIMAFFGAPVQREDDALQAVKAALDMEDAVVEFNMEQIEKGKPEFRIGIGINYGDVTVGNIGSERKMDYTVVGDMVNVAARLESLNKVYHQSLVFSENVYKKVKTEFRCRMLDKVIVVGKSKAERIFTAQKEIEEAERKGWDFYHTGMKYFYQRDFLRAAQYFKQTTQCLPSDYLAAMFLRRCAKLLKSPPSPDWDGVQVLTSK